MIGDAKCHLIPSFPTNQLATRVRHYPQIKSGDTCIGFPRHAALPSSTTQNVVVLCPHHRTTQTTAGIGWPWRQGRGTPPSRLSIVRARDHLMQLVRICCYFLAMLHQAMLHQAIKCHLSAITPLFISKMIKECRSKDSAFSLNRRT